MSRRRRSGLVVPMPDLDPVVGGFRHRWDPVAPLGVRAHVTVLFPFVVPDVAGDALLARVESVVAACRPFPVTFTGTAEFPDHVLYLVPTPAAPFIALTLALAAEFPDQPPYEGQFADVVPHLTVAHDAAAPRDELRSELSARLPVTTVAARVELWVEGDDDRWSARAGFAMRGGLEPTAVSGVRT